MENSESDHIHEIRTPKSKKKKKRHSELKDAEPREKSPRVSYDKSDDETFRSKSPETAISSGDVSDAGMDSNTSPSNKKRKKKKKGGEKAVEKANTTMKKEDLKADSSLAHTLSSSEDETGQNAVPELEGENELLGSLSKANPDTVKERERDPEGQLKSPKDENKSATTGRNRLSLTRKRKKSGEREGISVTKSVTKKTVLSPESRQESLPGGDEDSEPEGQGSVRTPERSNNFLTSTQDLFQSQSKRVRMSESQTGASKKLQIGNIDMSDDEAERFIEQTGTRCPPQEGFQPIEPTECAVWMEDAVGPQRELWLFRVPTEFNIDQLDSEEILLDGNVMLEKDTNRDTGSQWRINAISDETLEKANMVLVLPSKRNNKLCAAGSFRGQIAVTRKVNLAPYVVPEDTEQPPKLPGGLKIRHTPFGAGPDIKTKKGKKKRHKSVSEMTEGSKVPTSSKKKKRDMNTSACDSTQKQKSFSRESDASDKEQLSHSITKKKKHKKSI